MAYDNINDLPAAEIRFDENGDITDLDVAVLKDNVLNFTKFSNLPIYNKYQIDTKIKNFEELMTAKMQEQNMIGSIFVENENGELVQGNLKLSEIADKLKKYSCMEIGTRYNISVSTGTVTTHQGKRVVKKGNKIYIENVDPEATGLEIGVSKLLQDYETEVPAENKFAFNIYPWCDMKRVQISMNDTEFNYDTDIDNGGSYFTEVPLYYIKEEYLLEQESLVNVGGTNYTVYNPVYDLTSTWNTLDPVSTIPSRFLSDGNTYSIGMYKWVSKYPMNGYRPAEFFVKKVKAVPTVDNGTFADSVKRYVKIKLNDREFYQAYDKYAETDLFSYNVVTRYCLVTNDNNTDYVDVLASKHYFGCYEASTETYNSKQVLVSKPEKFPTVSTTLSTFRSRAKALSSNYYIRDMRSYTDFYGFLMDIEYKSLHSQSVINGVSNLSYSNTNIIYFDQTNTNKVILPYAYASGYVKGQTVICGASYGSTSGFSNSIVIDAPSPLVKDEDFTLEETNGDPVSYYYISDSNGERVFGTESSASLDGKVYYKMNIDTVTNDIYVIASTDGTDIASSIPSGMVKEDVIYYYNNNLYASISGALSAKMLYKYIIDKTASSLLSTYMCHSMSWRTGTTDILSQRTAVYSTTTGDIRRPFKWNWIENPYANIWKFIDGVHITHNAVPDVSVVHNAIYFCDNPALYSDSYIDYQLLTSYYAPGEGTHVTRLGFDPRYPWIQITSRAIGGSSNTYYADYYYQNSTAGSSSTRFVLAGGYWGVGANAGLRYFYLGFGLPVSYFNIGAAVERQEE